MTNDWTRADLPAVPAPNYYATPENLEVAKAVSKLLDTWFDHTVEHLNTCHPKPAKPHAQLQAMAGNMQRREIDRLIDLRDKATSRAERAEADRNSAQMERTDALEELKHWKTSSDEWKASHADAVRECNAAIAREEAANEKYEKVKGATLKQLDWAGFQCGEEYQDLLERAEKAERERDEWRKNAEHRSSAISGLEGRAESAERRAEEAEREATKSEPWSSADLPAAFDVTRVDGGHEMYCLSGVERDGLAKWLNDNHPKPGEETYVRVLDSAAEIHNLKADIADATRERDAATARANEAEKAMAKMAEAHEEIDSRLENMRKMHGETVVIQKRLEKRLEKQLTTSPVTREGIEKAMADATPGLAANKDQVDAVHKLLEGDDHAVYIIRESDIAAVEVSRDAWDKNRAWWIPSGVYTSESGERTNPPLEEVRAHAQASIRAATEYEALARAIEAEKTTEDPIALKCQELAPILFPGQMFGELSGVKTQVVERAARYLVGQETNDDE